MNIFLLPEKVSYLELPVKGDSACHILTVLKAVVGDVIDVGVKNGPKGKATLQDITKVHLKLSLIWNDPHPCDLYPATLVVGMARPQTCRKILEQASAMGVSRIDFFMSEKSELSYRDSRLWRSNEWEEKIFKGVEQAFSTFLPQCKIWADLKDCIDDQPSGSKALALDNYESSYTLNQLQVEDHYAYYTIAIGSERGWSNSERELLRDQGFTLVSMGPRVLRQETAVVVALGQVLSKFWDI